MKYLPLPYSTYKTHKSALMQPPKRQYFILAVWQEFDPVLESTSWRIRLENPRTGEKWGFKTPKLLARQIQSFFNKETLDD